MMKIEFEEKLSYTEDCFFKEFFKHENIQNIVQMTGMPDRDVIDFMYDAFTHELGMGNITSVFSIAKLNQITADKVSRARKGSATAMKNSRRVGFEQNRIPKSFLPRPVFSDF